MNPPNTKPGDREVPIRNFAIYLLVSTGTEAAVGRG